MSAATYSYRQSAPAGGASEYAVRSDPVLVGALKGMPLFEALTDAQVNWLATHSEVVTYKKGERVFIEGQPAEALFVLIEGQWRIAKIVGGYETVLVTTDQPGTWGGALPFGAGTYEITGRVLRPSRMLRVRADDVSHMLESGFPIAAHLLAGLSRGARNTQALVGQQEKMAALGKLSAGLAHELNNPASAGRRAAGSLREGFERLQSLALELGALGLAPEQLRALNSLRRDAARTAREAPELTPIGASDREDELNSWLDGHGVADGWQLAPTFVNARLDAGCLDSVARQAPPEALGTVLNWLSAGLEAEALVGEIEGSTARISQLVDSVREYSYMDRAPEQDVDVHDGLENTLVMLGHRLKGGVGVVREYDRSLPRVPARGSELNQVWTNLIDNALDAMGGEGTLTLRTVREGDRVLVEIGDTGPGIPSELQSRIWEPFFTTKGVGEGTGLGLDVSYRIVVTRHHGDIRVESRPGDTRFQVRLPVVSHER
jgi:signal transduction histidine kinase